MFCSKCGKEIKGDHDFCKECGTKVERDEATQPNVEPEPQSAPISKKPLNKKLLGIAGIALVGIVVGVFLLVFNGGLGTEEQRIFDSLIISMDRFHDPSSVRVLETSAIPNMWGDDRIVIRVQSRNRAGGTTTNLFWMMLEDGRFGERNVRKGWMQEISPDPTGGSLEALFGLSTDHVNIGSINRALERHFRNLGV
jgi:hypothetical protein